MSASTNEEQLDLESFPIKIKRDLRVSSPQPVYRAVADLLEERDFRVVQSEAPEPVAGALPGTASFKGRLIGVRDIPSSRPLRASAAFLAGGTALIVLSSILIFVSSQVFISLLSIAAGLVLIGLGIAQFRDSGQRLRHLVEIRMEGESYQAGASRIGPSPSRDQSEGFRIERTGIVSDLRLTLFAGKGVAQGESGVSRWLPGNESEVLGAAYPSRDANERPALRQRGELVQMSGPGDGRFDRQLDGLIDQFALPEAVS